MKSNFYILNFIDNESMSYVDFWKRSSGKCKDIKTTDLLSDELYEEDHVIDYDIRLYIILLTRLISVMTLK